MSTARNATAPRDASTDKAPLWPIVVVWVPLLALTISILGPWETLVWQSAVVPGHGVLWLARRKLPDWGAALVFACWWVGTGLVLWNWGPDGARSALASVLGTACLVGAIGQTRREGLSHRLEKLGRERLVEGLILLSLPAEEQIRAVRTIPQATDVSEAVLAQILGPFYLIRDHSAEPVGELFGLLQDIEALINAQPEGFRTDESLRTSPTWEQLRTLARTALDKVGVDRRVPDLDFLREPEK